MKIDKGGIGMIDVYLFDKALKLTWVRRYFKSPASWKLLVDKVYPNFKEIFNYGDEYELKISNEITHPFWSNIVQYYYIFQKQFKLYSKEEVEATRFLYNSNIKIGKKVIKNKKLISSNIFAISQLRYNNRFLTLQEINTKLFQPLNFLEYNSIISALKKYMDKYSNLKPFKEVTVAPALNSIMSKEKGSSNIYQNFIAFEKDITGFKRWCKKTNISNEAWLSSFQFLKRTTSDTKLRWLQYRILHYIITTNRSVSKFIPGQNSNCTFCGAHSETIIHLFWGCNFVQSFWKAFSFILNKKCIHAHNFKFTENLVLFGKCNMISTDKVCDLIILIAKFYIYRCKVQKNILNVNVFIKELYKRYHIEKIINKNSNAFKNCWIPYLNLFKGILT